MEGLREQEAKKKKEDMKPVGVRGARVGEVNAAKVVIRDRLMMKNATVRKALKDLDEDGSGVLGRDEIKKFLKEQSTHCTHHSARPSRRASRVAHPPRPAPPARPYEVL